MEYIEGEELLDTVTSKGGLTETELAGYIQQILYAINYCHA